MVCSIAMFFTATAQTLQTAERESNREPASFNQKTHGLKSLVTLNHQMNTPESIIWSEDFANGIPATWMNSGTANSIPDPDAVWEYRGPSGAQPATVGSIGAYANPAVIIQSPTASNGFVIFDSDYLDNGGTPGNFGGGLAPSPHNSTLVTPVIDLSNEPNVILTFYQYYRRFGGPGGSQAIPATYIDVSTDGGATWGTTYTLNAGVPVNSATGLGDFQNVNMTSVLAGQAQARLRLRFDGDYYFWMVDDLELSGPIPYDMDFLALDGWDEVDWIIGDGSKMGINSRAQPQPWVYLSSIFNRGSQSLDNVQLEVGVLKDGAPFAMASSAVYPSLPAGDTLDYSFLNTVGQDITPTENGYYQWYYQVSSDSITLSTDTFQTFITSNIMSLDYNYYYNTVGTSSAIALDSCKLASRIDFEGNDTIRSVFLGIGASSAGSQIAIEIYDSSAFGGYTTGFDPAGRLAFVNPVTLDPINTFQGEITIALNEPLYIADSIRSVYIVATLIRNGFQVNIINDQTVDAVIPTSLMYYPGLQWYTGYTNSRSFDSPWIRAITSGGVCNYDLVIDSITDVNSNKGVYRAYFGNLPGTDYRLEYRAVGAQNWETKSIAGAAIGSQNFNITPLFGSDIEVRLAVEIGNQWSSGCETIIEVPCKPLTASMVVQRPARCSADSVLVRAGYAGGYGAVSFMWSNGATTKRTYADQGEKLTVTLTDAAGCSVTDSITAASLDNTAIPENFSLSKDNATTFTGSWTAPALPTGASLIGYRMAYRLRGTQSYTNLPSTTGLSTTVDFTGSGLPAGNYEFVVFTRYNDGTSAVNSNFTCIEAKGYTGVGNKNDASTDASSSSIHAIYPNPTNGVVYVATEEGAEVSLLDISGRVITKAVANSSEVSFDMSNLAQGVYMIRIENNSETITEQVVKN
jgi:hypothetical protein